MRNNRSSTALAGRNCRLLMLHPACHRPCLRKSQAHHIVSALLLQAPQASAVVFHYFRRHAHRSLPAQALVLPQVLHHPTQLCSRLSYC